MKHPGKKIHTLLLKLNREYVRLHKDFENYYWRLNLGETGVTAKYQAAETKLNQFKTNELYAQAVDEAVRLANKTEKVALLPWQQFFQAYSSTKLANAIYIKISKLENKINARINTRKEGYIDPKTKMFIPASWLQMAILTRTHKDEKVRKAAFTALEKLAESNIADYATLIPLRNEYAQALGYEDFYTLKLDREEKLTKKEVFELFENVYSGINNVFTEIKKLEKVTPGLRKPWNRHYYLEADTASDLEKYFPFTASVERWLTSFTRLGVDFAAGTLKLDLLARKGKLANGFCHWPIPVHYKDNQRIAGQANFTSNVSLSQPGSSLEGYRTFFHEGGHAAHLLNNQEKQVCLNTEFQPLSTAWAETQSIFMDTMMESPEWLISYGESATNEKLTLSTFKKIEQQKPIHTDLFLFKIAATAEFEKRIYEDRVITPQKIKRYARTMYTKYNDTSISALAILNTPHLYRFEWSCSYHSYGLAKLAVAQWREHFHKKYGFIVDNKKVGPEMTKVWKFGAKYNFTEFVVQATGKKLSAKPYIKSATRNLDKKISDARQRLSLQPKPKKSISTPKVDIYLVHGKEIIANSKHGIAKMCRAYEVWLKKQTQEK